MFKYVSWGPIIIGILSFVTLIVWESKKIKSYAFFKSIPGALAVVILAILTDLVFSLYIPSLKVKQEHLVNLPVIQSGADLMNNFAFPDFSKIHLPAIYETALIIAMVASLETLLNLEAVDKLDPHNDISPTNR